MKISKTKCEICGKGDTVSYNRPKSLHGTARIVRANLQEYNKKLICTRCLRTQAKNN